MQHAEFARRTLNCVFVIPCKAGLVFKKKVTLLKQRIKFDWSVFQRQEDNIKMAFQEIGRDLWLVLSSSKSGQYERITYVEITSVRPSVFLWLSVVSRKRDICENGRNDSRNLRKNVTKFCSCFLHLSPELDEIQVKRLPCNNAEQIRYSEKFILVHCVSEISPVFSTLSFRTV